MATKYLHRYLRWHIIDERVQRMTAGKARVPLSRSICVGAAISLCAISAAPSPIDGGRPGATSRRRPPCRARRCRPSDADRHAARRRGTSDTALPAAADHQRPADSSRTAPHAHHRPAPRPSGEVGGRPPHPADHQPRPREQRRSGGWQRDVQDHRRDNFRQKGTSARRRRDAGLGGSSPR